MVLVQELFTHHTFVFLFIIYIFFLLFYCLKNCHSVYTKYQLITVYNQYNKSLLLFFNYKGNIIFNKIGTCKCLQYFRECFKI